MTGRNYLEYFYYDIKYDLVPLLFCELRMTNTLPFFFLLLLSLFLSFLFLLIIISFFLLLIIIILNPSILDGEPGRNIYAGN